VREKVGQKRSRAATVFQRILICLQHLCSGGASAAITYGGEVVIAVVFREVLVTLFFGEINLAEGGW